jgi:dTMP kinase
MSRGNYLVIEGGEAVGKSLQSEMLMEEIQRLGREAIHVREPGGTAFGEDIRQVLLGKAKHHRSPESNFDLFTAARRELGRQVIGPALEDGTWVISDRSWMSSMAYQGFGEGVDKRKILRRSQEAMGKLFKPDKTIILDLPSEVMFERLEARGNYKDFFESQDGQFFDRVRIGYLWLVDGRYGMKIDASPEPRVVFGQILGSLCLEDMILRE